MSEENMSVEVDTNTSTEELTFSVDTKPSDLNDFFENSLTGEAFPCG